MLLRSLSLVLLGTLASSALSFVNQLVLARVLELSEYGQLSALLAAINLATPVAGFGVAWLWLQVFGKEGRAAKRWISPTVRLLSVSLSLSYAFLLIYIYRNRSLQSDQLIFASFSALFILMGQCSIELIASVFQIERQYGYVSIWQIFIQCGRLASILVLFLGSRHTLNFLLMGYAAVGVAASCGCAIIVKRFFRLAEAQISSNHCSLVVESQPTLIEAGINSMPFAMSTIFYLISFQSVVILVDAFSGSRASALYQSALVITQAVYLIPSIIYMKFLLAYIFKWSEHDRDMYRSSFYIGVVGMTTLGTFCMLGTIFLSRYVVPVVLGEKYVNAIQILNILAICMPINFAQHVFSSLYTSQSDVRRRVFCSGGAALTCLISTSCLLPLFGYIGAAYAAILSEIVGLLLIVYVTRRTIKDVNPALCLHATTLIYSLSAVTNRSRWR